MIGATTGTGWAKCFTQCFTPFFRIPENSIRHILIIANAAVTFKSFVGGLKPSKGATVLYQAPDISTPYTYMRYKAKNKGDVTPERIDKLVNTIYRNLIKKPNTKLDVGWVEEVVFEQEPSHIPRGVNGSYFRMQMVNEMHKSFAKQAEKDEAENVQAQVQQAAQQAAQQQAGNTQQA